MCEKTAINTLNQNTKKNKNLAHQIRLIYIVDSESYSNKVKLDKKWLILKTKFSLLISFKRISFSSSEKGPFRRRRTGSFKMKFVKDIICYHFQ